MGFSLGSKHILGFTWMPRLTAAKEESPVMRCEMLLAAVSGCYFLGNLSAGGRSAGLFLARGAAIA